MNLMHKLTAVSVLMALALTAPAMAETAEEKGLAIATEMDKRDTGFDDHTATMEMVLINRKGDRVVRAMRMLTLEGKGDGDKTIIVFDNPRDIKGTSMLTFTHKEGPDDQWLFLPKLKRVKRIASNNKSGSFMGSEFSYEDMASQEVEKYTYKYIKDEVLDGTDCYVVERYPVDKKSGYTRQVVWVNKRHYIAEKIDFYDRKKALLKSLRFKQYKQYLDTFWRSHELHMVNVQKGKETILGWKDFKFRTGLKDSQFNQTALKRMR